MVCRNTAVPDDEPIEELIPIVLLVKFTFPVNVSRAVPLLVTLFLLSYMKLLRTVIDAISIAVIARYEHLLCCVVPQWKPTLLPAPSHLPFRSSHCYFYILVASLHIPASVHAAFEESVSSKATQVDQQASPLSTMLTSLL